MFFFYANANFMDIVSVPSPARVVLFTIDCAPGLDLGPSGVDYAIRLPARPRTRDAVGRGIGGWEMFQTIWVIAIRECVLCRFFK